MIRISTIIETLDSPYQCLVFESTHHGHHRVSTVTASFDAHRTINWTRLMSAGNGSFTALSPRLRAVSCCAIGLGVLGIRAPIRARSPWP
jgi:hypothetical protein